MLPPPSPRDFVRLLSPALEQAAAIAVALEGRVANEPKHGEASAVKAALTMADTAAQEALLVPLAARFAEARLEAEEDTRSVALFRGGPGAPRIVVDPIDGTLHFFLGARGPYAMMAGLALADRYEAAGVALPREGLRFEAVRGGGATLVARARPPAPPALSRHARRVWISDGVPAAVGEHLRAQGFEVGLASGGAVAVAPLVPGVRAGLRVSKYDSISARGRIGLLVARESGALVETGEGEPFPDGVDARATSLVVAADAEAARALREALRAAGGASSYMRV